MTTTMTRHLALATKTYIQFYPLKRNAKEMVIVKNRLYRCDESVMCANVDGTDEMALYPIDGTQPAGYGEYLDADYTFELIDSAADAGLGIGKIGGLFGGNWWQLFTGLLIGGAILYAFGSSLLG